MFLSIAPSPGFPLLIDNLHTTGERRNNSVTFCTDGFMIVHVLGRLGNEAIQLAYLVAILRSLIPP